MTQTEALAILKTGLNVFLTGEPGSGKTHTINAHVRWLQERGVDAAVTASTGIAATHIDGMTIHSWSGIGVKRYVNDYDIEYIQSKEKTARRIIDAKVLIIDEISMLDATTLESVDRVLRTLRRRPLMPEEPFGGLQVIFVGDFFQLPPVTRRSESEGGREERPKFAFESSAWKDANPVICYLNEQHRQDDGEFLALLGAMRSGAVTQAHREQLRGRMNATTASGATRLYTHNADVDRINNDALQKIDGSSHVFQMTSRGAASLVETLKKNCLSPETLVLKEGAMVMFTRNNFEAGYVNGTLAEVVGFTPLGTPIVRTRQGLTLNVEPVEWAIQDGNRILARLSQVPLRLAWAITVHKSQGMSLESALVDLASAFEYGQGYVAISRVRSLAGLHLVGFNERALEMHPGVVAQDRYFRAYSDAARKKFATLASDDKEKMEKNFLRAIGAKEPKSVAPDSGAPGDLRNSLRSDIARSPSAPESGAADPRAALREKYPNMGKPWKQEDDDTLKAMFTQDVKQGEIAKHFGRKPSAIHARLAHLGLIEDDWFANRNKKKNLAE